MKKGREGKTVQEREKRERERREREREEREKRECGNRKKMRDSGKEREWGKEKKQKNGREGNRGRQPLTCFTGLYVLRELLCCCHPEFLSNLLLFKFT